MWDSGVVCIRLRYTPSGDTLKRVVRKVSCKDKILG